MASIYSSGLVIAAGTYDGVLGGWEFSDETKSDSSKNEVRPLTLSFATAVHEGSVRSLCMAGNVNQNEPGALLSSGYDETLKTHDWSKRQTSSGEVRTPAGFGTPICSAFAPPAGHSTHCVVGFSSEGKICIYKKRDWSVQHVLAGHDGGIGALAVHPTGKVALSGGVTDGKLKLWDLTKGRLSFVDKISPASTRGGRARYDPITSVTWSKGGDFYAFSHGSHVTAREVESGKALLDVEMPSRINQLALMSGPEGLFVVAACNDGSLPVLAVEDSEEESRKAVMAIEPVDSHLAREERFKCIQSVRDYYVVTANSAGVVSLMNLQGAINMMMSESETENENSLPDDDESEDSRSGDEDDMELAVDIVESVRLGTGARITCLAAWCKTKESQIEEAERQEQLIAKVEEKNEPAPVKKSTHKRKLESKADEFMDEDALKKARSLVKKAKKLKSKREKKKKKLKK
jgi:WD40 repeat protein